MIYKDLGEPYKKGGLTIYNCDCMDLMARYEDNYWKPIPLFEHYFISSKGLVFNTRTKTLKKSCHDHKGYKRIRLIDGRKRGATKKIHRLVAQAFLSDYKETLQVNHKDGIKDNNDVSNLEMATQSQNTQHAWDNGFMKLAKKDKYGRFCKSC